MTTTSHLNRNVIDYMEINGGGLEGDFEQYQEMYPPRQYGRRKDDMVILDAGVSQISLSKPNPQQQVASKKAPKKRCSRPKVDVKTYSDEDIERVLMAYFNDPEITSMEAAGATVGMPKPSARKLINTYKPLLPKVQKKRKARKAKSKLAVANNDLVAKLLQKMNASQSSS
ncbi:hypothetical protein BJV82DRAFT_675538 [Fennellomyces sp. T-0311]|nr:hypothetical protein BJV82DRAFT_675538 [Fennellomyces sp. T-0311]